MVTARAGAPGAVSFDVMLRRLLGVAAFLAAPTLVAILYSGDATRRFVRFLCAYSPEIFVHGHVWTLVGSAFLLTRLKMGGPTSLFIVAIFLPYAFAAGALAAARTFLIGHCVATLAVLAVVLPAVWLGIGPHFQVIYRNEDVGVSAGLAACSGALSVVIARRAPAVGWTLLAAVAYFFLHGLVYGKGGGHGLTDVEHLLALTTGVIVELRLGHPASTRAGRSWARRS